MTMAKRTNHNSPARRRLLFPNLEEFRAFRSRLPKFKPQDFRKLAEAARAETAAVNEEAAFVSALRSENEKQIARLLRLLGLSPTSPDRRLAFLLLATVHHGVGQIEWRRRRPSRNAATWGSEHDLALYQEMSALKARGLSERKAIEKLAADRGQRQLFPYKAQIRPGSRMDARSQRAAALRARWTQVKRRSRSLRFQDAFGVG
jgi:hypothetical protein